VVQCTAPRFSHRKAEAAFQEYMSNMEDITEIDDTMFEEKSQQII